jgi:hypothetical protein
MPRILIIHDPDYPGDPEIYSDSPAEVAVLTKSHAPDAFSLGGPQKFIGVVRNVRPSAPNSHNQILIDRAFAERKNSPALSVF